MSTTPYQFIHRGSLFIRPVGPSIDEVPYPTQSFTKPRDFSLWVHGQIMEPAFQLDSARMPPSLYQEVRNDLVRYSPVEVSRSAFQRSNHAYTGVIDSKGTPYYFALDSRGISVREAKVDDENVWKTFDRLSDHERGIALRQRRHAADGEMRQVDRELSTPQLVIVKSDPDREVARGFATYKEDGTPIKKPSFYQKLRGMVGKPRTDITDTGDDAPKIPKMKLLSKAEVHTGTMVSLHLPREIAEQIALAGGEAPESMHITFAYLGKNLTDEQKSAAVCAVRRFAQQAGPIKATLGGVGRFSASHTSEGRDVVYLSVDSPDITRLRPKLLEELAAEGIEPSNAHGYVPHVTLAYVKTTARTPLKRFPPLAVEFPCVSLTVANKQMMLPFTPPAALVVSIQVVQKALPKKTKEEKVKKTPSKKSSSKKAGAGGKTRYSYPNEKKKAGAGAGGGGKPAQPLSLVITQHDDSKNANPSELANQLGVSMRTLQRCAKKLGREGFAKFMRSHLKRFSAKHRLDPDYWGTLYEQLQPGVG
jgi:2'-5' RNA ligase